MQPHTRFAVLRSTAGVALLLATDKLLGVVREAVVGHAFGTSAAMDAYIAAFEVPEGLNTVVAGAALTTSLIPLLAGAVAHAERESLWRFFSTVLNWVLLVVGVAGLAAALLARPIILAVAPGFADDPAQVVLAVRLMRLVLVQTLIFSASSVVTGALEAHRHFLLPALAPLCYTLGRIFGATVLAPSLGIFGLAWGGLTGAALHLLIKLPWLIHRRARWTLTFSHADLLPLLRLMGPRVMGMGVTYVNYVLPTFLGSRLPGGAIAAYEYAWKLMQLPETVLGTALGIVILPTLAALAARDEGEGTAELRRTFAWSLRLTLALSIPAGVGLLTLGRPLTALFLQRGAFDAAATERVYHALRFFALGIVAHSALEVAARLFYARREMWTPFWAAVCGLAINAALGWALRPRLAHSAIALSNSIGAACQVILLLAAARRPLGGIEGRAMGQTLLRTAIASALMGAAVTGFRALLPPGAGPLVEGLGGLVGGGGVYLAAAMLVGVEEVRALPKLLLRRDRRAAA